MLLSFVQEWIQSDQELHWIIFPGVSREVTCGVCCSPVGTADLCKQHLKLADEEKLLATFLKADTYWDWVQHGGA
jgi:hypothetical protein